MTFTEIESRIIELAAEHGGVATTDVTRDSHLVNDLHYDSLEEVEFAMDVEDEFRVVIPDEKAQTAKTVGAVIDLVVEAKQE